MSEIILPIPEMNTSELFGHGSSPTCEEESQIDKETAQFNLIPPKPEDQISFAFRVIQGAWDSKLTQFQADIKTLVESLAEKTLISSNLEKKNAAVEKENVEIKLKNSQLVEDNRSLILHLNKIKTENQEFDKMKKMILNTVTKTNNIEVTKSQELEEMFRKYDTGAINKNSQFQQYPGTTECSVLSEFAPFRSCCQPLSGLYHGSTEEGFFQSPGISNKVSPIYPERNGREIVHLNLGRKIGSPRSGCISPLMDSPRAQVLPTNNTISCMFKTPSNQTPERSLPQNSSQHAAEHEIDGKMFFKLVKERLSGQQFALFLNNIKKLNSKALTKEETLIKAQELFGMNNAQLFNTFKLILSPDLNK